MKVCVSGVLELLAAAPSRLSSRSPIFPGSECERMRPVMSVTTTYFTTFSSIMVFTSICRTKRSSRGNMADPVLFDSMPARVRISSKTEFFASSRIRPEVPRISRNTRAVKTREALMASSLSLFAFIAVAESPI